MPGGSTLEAVSGLTGEVSQMRSIVCTGSLVELLSALEATHDLVPNRSLSRIAISDNDQQIACAAHAGVHDITGLKIIMKTVDSEHDHWALKPLEACNCGIENVIALPEEIPMLLAVDMSGLGLHWMAMLGGEHGNVIARITAVLDEIQGDIVSDTKDVSCFTLDEFDG
jgi:hypothetical protein